MKEVWFFFSYGGYPVWYRVADNEPRDNGLPPEFENDQDLIEPMKELDKIYRSLFINNSYEFTYVGFQDEKSWSEFITKVNKFIELLRERVEPEYKLILDQWTRNNLRQNWKED